MEVEAVRFVSDRFEWSSMTNDAALYHRWEWSEQSRRRVARQLPTTTVGAAYLRIWVHDTMITCPVILIGDIWYNTPRAQPMTVVGDPISPADVIDDLDVDVVIVDDTAQLTAITTIAERLTDHADETRSRRSVTAAETATMRSRLAFADAESGDTWFEGVEWIWRTGWDARLIEYRRCRQPIGWTVEVSHKNAAATVVAAAHVDEVVPAWTSPR